jgi:hypothetical protein
MNCRELVLVIYKDFFFWAALVLAGRLVAQTPAQETLDGAISRATEIINKGITSYPEHRSCFSCHHQALPLLAHSVGNVQRADARRSFYAHQLTRDVAAFTERSFSTKRKSLMAGGEIAVAVYGLRSYAHSVIDEERLQAAYQRALAWSRQLGEPANHEDLIGQVWLE